jgi:hypothetical protein
LNPALFTTATHSLDNLLRSSGQLDKKDILTLVADMLLAGLDPINLRFF